MEDSLVPSESFPVYRGGDFTNHYFWSKQMPVSFWSEEDFQFIKSNYDKMSHQEMADKIGKTKDAVKKKCRVSGLVKKVHADWNESNLQFLKDNWENMLYKDIGEKLGMSEKMVFLQAQRLGFSKEVTVSIGDKFNRLEVIAPPEIEVTGNQTKSFVKCKCDCGTETKLKMTDLISGRTISCGCYQKEVASKFVTEMNTTHGKSGSRTYKVWSEMKSRACSASIPFFDAWNDFERFEEWVVSKGYSNDKHRIFRKDMSKGFSPDNCMIQEVNHAG